MDLINSGNVGQLIVRSQVDKVSHFEDVPVVSDVLQVVGLVVGVAVDNCLCVVPGVRE